MCRQEKGKDNQCVIIMCVCARDAIKLLLSAIFITSINYILLKYQNNYCKPQIYYTSSFLYCHSYIMLHSIALTWT